jgi:predicted small secreted protein
VIKKLLALLLVIGCFGSLAACNTVAGFGKDVERAGEATQDSANRNR